MKTTISTYILACILIMIPVACAVPADGPVLSLMIDADIPASASDVQFQEASTLLHLIYVELYERDLGATFFAPQDMVQAYGRLRLTYIGKDPHFELGMSGNSSDEKLSAKSYSEQKTILQRSKEAIEACKICGKNEIVVWGFMPPSFNQNEDTYEALDELGIEYNAGFQAGVIYAPGHQEDVWPYKLENYGFYAVPVSTYDLSGQKVPLQDKYFNENGLSSAQWYNALVGKFDEIQNKDEPMVIVITKSISGSGEYFEAFKNFLDFATSKNATFVPVKDLVNKSREEAYLPPADSIGNQEEDDFVAVSIEATGNISTSSEGCSTCGNKTQINASIAN